MKAYTMDREGIVLNAGMLSLGQEGRGRRLVRIPLPPGAEVDGDWLMSAPGPDGAALLFIPDQSGYRGGWSLHLAAADGEWDALVDIADTSAQRERRAEVAQEFPTDRIIAEGCCAQGDAGGMGGGPEYLLVLRDWDAVEIARDGRLYGAPRYTRLACVAGEIVATNPLAEARTRAAGAAWGKVGG